MNLQNQLISYRLLAAEVLADGIGFGDESVAENGHGGGSVLVDEVLTFGGVGLSVAEEESGDLVQDGLDEGLVLEQLGQVADECGAGLAVQSSEKRKH